MSKQKFYPYSPPIEPTPPVEFVDEPNKIKEVENVDEWTYVPIPEGAVTLQAYCASQEYDEYDITFFGPPIKKRNPKYDREKAKYDKDYAKWQENTKEWTQKKKEYDAAEKEKAKQRRRKEYEKLKKEFENK